MDFDESDAVVAILVDSFVSCLGEILDTNIWQRSAKLDNVCAKVGNIWDNISHNISYNLSDNLHFDMGTHIIFESCPILCFKICRAFA